MRWSYKGCYTLPLKFLYSQLQLLIRTRLLNISIHHRFCQIIMMGISRHILTSAINWPSGNLKNEFLVNAPSINMSHLHLTNAYLKFSLLSWYDNSFKMYATNMSTLRKHLACRIIWGACGFKHIVWGGIFGKNSLITLRLHGELALKTNVCGSSLLP